MIGHPMFQDIMQVFAKFSIINLSNKNWNFFFFIRNRTGLTTHTVLTAPQKVIRTVAIVHTDTIMHMVGRTTTPTEMWVDWMHCFKI